MRERPPWMAVLGVLGALAMVVLSAAMTTVALPALSRSLEVSSAEALRVVTAYQLALVVALLPSAALGESLGYKRVFTGGVALFSVASAAAALAPSLPWLLVARVVQGLGGAAVMALAVALLRLIVPPGRLAAAIGWNALTVALSSAAAPTLGALVLAGAGAEWIFALHVPLGLVVLVAARALPPSPGTSARVDAVSVALNAATFASFVFGAELVVRSPVAGAAALSVSALALAILVRRELPKPAPLIPLDLLRGRPFRLSVIASICCFTGQTAALVALPFHVELARGHDALVTGLLITPWPLGVALAAPLAGRLADRVSTAWLCAAGGAVLAVGLALAALRPPTDGAAEFTVWIALCGLGFGLFQVPNNRNLLLAAPVARSAAAGGMQGTARLIGQTAGALLMTLLFALAPTAATRLGLGVAAGLTLTAGLVSTLRSERAAVR